MPQNPDGERKRTTMKSSRTTVRLRGHSESESGGPSAFQSRLLYGDWRPSERSQNRGNYLRRLTRKITTIIRTTKPSPPGHMNQPPPLEYPTPTQDDCDRTSNAPTIVKRFFIWSRPPKRKSTRSRECTCASRTRPVSLWKISDKSAHRDWSSTVAQNTPRPHHCAG